MQTEVFLRNKIRRQIKWNGQEFIFRRYALNNYSEIDYNTVDKEFIVNGIFHEGSSENYESKSKGTMGLHSS